MPDTNMSTPESLPEPEKMNRALVDIFHVALAWETDLPIREKILKLAQDAIPTTAQIMIHKTLQDRLAEVEKELGSEKVIGAALSDIIEAQGKTIESQQKANAELVKDKERAIELLKEFASKSADFMEGAGLPEFKIYEDQMCWATQTLHKLGIWFDPISGITKTIAKGGTQ